MNRRTFLHGLPLLTLSLVGCVPTLKIPSPSTPKDESRAKLEAKLKERFRLTEFHLVEGEGGTLVGSGSNSSGVTFTITVNPIEHGYQWTYEDDRGNKGSGQETQQTTTSH